MTSSAATSASCGHASPTRSSSSTPTGKKTLEQRLAGLDKVVYHSQLGSQGERVGRVRALAKAIASLLGDADSGDADSGDADSGSELVGQADRAAMLAKADLLTEMVGEFPELQGIMGGYYARNDGEADGVAEAIEDHYKPRFAGDELPRNRVGIAVALADKLETLIGLFGIGQLPTGDKDPFALRRHALGAIRMLVETRAAAASGRAVPAGGHGLRQPRRGPAGQAAGVLLRSPGDNAEGPGLHRAGDRCSRQPAAAAAGRRARAARRRARVLEAARSGVAGRRHKRIGNILKKSAARDDAKVDPTLLQDDQEKALHAELQKVSASASPKFASGDHEAALSECAALRAPVDAFFDAVMVNADDEALRNNRHALLRELHSLMNHVADLSKLAS